MCRNKVSTHTNQWQLIGILIVGVKNLPGKVWENSFCAVNLHPKHRLSSLKWLEKIDSHVRAGKTMYVRTNNSMYNVMPFFWKK